MNVITCNLCGSASYTKVLEGYDRYLNTDRTLFTLVQCTRCGLIYMNPQPSIEELSPYYRRPLERAGG